MALNAQRRKHMDGIANFVPHLLQAVYAVF